jgi:hypothetical protein
MNLYEQIYDFLNNHPNKEDCISAEEFKEMFLLGFARQMQLDIEQFFEFTVEDVGNGNCNIVAKLKQTHETTCHILNEFFLKENLPQVKAMFGMPDVAVLEEIGDGIAEI